MKPALLKKALRLLVELAILCALFLLGGQLATWLGWPIPGGVMGLALLLLLFASGVLQPAMLQLGALIRDEGWRILLVIAASTLMVMVVTALTVELVCRWRLRHEP